MHNVFALQYKKRLLARFGLNGYVCCEDLSKKLNDVFTIPNLLRISISAFANVNMCASTLKDHKIFSWKPHPGHLVGDSDEQNICTYFRHPLEQSREHGNVLEIILKDRYTCEYHPERFDH